MRLILSIVSVSIFLVTMTCFVYLPKQETLASSFAFLQNQRQFYVQDLSDGILLKEAIPMTDEKGLTLDSYRFKVVNKSKADITYQIKFVSNKEKIKSQGKEVLDNKYLRYTLKDGNHDYLEPNTLNEDGIIYETTIDSNSEVVFEFKMWLDWNADNNSMNKVFIGKIEIEQIS